MPLTTTLYPNGYQGTGATNHDGDTFESAHVGLLSDSDSTTGLIIPPWNSAIEFTFHNFHGPAGWQHPLDFPYIPSNGQLYVDLRVETISGKSNISTELSTDEYMTSTLQTQTLLGLPDLFRFNILTDKFVTPLLVSTLSGVNSVSLRLLGNAAEVYISEISLTITHGESGGRITIPAGFIKALGKITI